MVADIIRSQNTLALQGLKSQLRTLLPRVWQAYERVGKEPEQSQLTPYLQSLRLRLPPDVVISALDKDVTVSASQILVTNDEGDTPTKHKVDKMIPYVPSSLPKCLDLDRTGLKWLRVRAAFVSASPQGHLILKSGETVFWLYTRSQSSFNPGSTYDLIFDGRDQSVQSAAQKLRSMGSRPMNL